MSDTQAHRDAVAAEYGQYRAIQPIRVDGVLAYNVGSAVPVSNVEKYGYLEDGLVERVPDAPASTDNPSVVLTKPKALGAGTEG